MSLNPGLNDYIFSNDESRSKKIEEELRKTNQRLLDIIEFLPDATFVIDQEQKIIAWNRAVEEMTGVKKEDVIGKGDYLYAEYFYGKCKPILVNMAGTLLENVGETANYKYIERKGDTLYGEVFVSKLYGGKGAFLWVKASPLYDKFGNWVGAIETLRDLTERKQMEERVNHLRSNIVQTLLATLRERDVDTEGHANRLQETVVAFGLASGLPRRTLTDLRLLAQFHDIGKIGITDRILLKPGSFTAEELTEMHKHCEIGYRIAQTSTELSPIADMILKHHEWWNGQGYPLGLKGEEIPLECRILAIADAYDAMIHDRPYRKAMPKAEAFKELKKWAGSQFAPELVEKFLIIMK